MEQKRKIPADGRQVLQGQHNRGNESNWDLAIGEEHTEETLWTGWGEFLEGRDRTKQKQRLNSLWFLVFGECYGCLCELSLKKGNDRFQAYRV